MRPLDRVRRALPRLSGDLLLLHPPAHFDFRGCRDVYFPFLGTSGDVAITPLYEYFPLGFKTLRRYLGERGCEVRLLNLATLLLRYPGLDWEEIAGALDFRVIGIDLHWMVHVQGSLAVAESIRALRPDLPILLGGLSATYYAAELIRYPFVDLVMRGYDTHEPMARLMTAVAKSGSWAGIPNLLWKTAAGEVRDNGLSHCPAELVCGVDWSDHPVAPGDASLPIRELVSTQSAGCKFQCGWCGGARDAFRRIYDAGCSVVGKRAATVAEELASVRRMPGSSAYHFYAVGCYNSAGPALEAFLDRIGELGCRSVNYEQHGLTPEPVLERMVRANPRTTITLSPESHDLKVAQLAGRGIYTNDELERWLERAFDAGIHQVDLWYFIGMPEQDARSVSGTVDYCRRLLGRFPGGRLNPMICPMIPLLDPGSTFFEEPLRHGYRVFHRTAGEHRRAMRRPSIIHRINYETRWLSRADLVRVGFRAVQSLMEAKGEAGCLPRGITRRFNARIEDALGFLGVVHEADSLEDPLERSRELAQLGDEILRRNEQVLYDGVMNQAFPVSRSIGGRWFDELGWETAELEAATEDGSE